MLLLLVITGVEYWPYASKQHPVFIDEPAWVTTSLLTHRLYVTLAPSSMWERAYDEKSLGDWGNKNPPVGKALIGAAVAPFVEASDTMDYRWQWGASYRDNMLNGHLPPPHLLLPARAATLVTGIACLLLVYLLAIQLSVSPWLALVPAFLLSRMPTYEFLSVRVHTDLTMLMFVLAGLLCLARGIAKQGRMRVLIPGAVCCGLACATKLSAGAFAVGFVLSIILTAPGRWRRVVKALGCAAVMAGVFVIVNPYLYPAPVGRTIQLQRDWGQSKKNQQASPELANQAVRDFGHRLLLTTERGVLRPSHPHELASPRAAGFAAAIPTAAGLALLGTVLWIVVGWRIRTTLRRSHMVLAVLATALAVLLEWLVFGGTGPLAPLSLAGIAALIWERGLAKEQRDLRVAYACCYGLTWLLTAMWLPFDWARYYMPIVVFTTLSWGIGLAWFARGFTVFRGEPLVARPSVRKLLSISAAAAWFLGALELATAG